MTKALLRKKVHKYVDQVDEKTLRMLDAMLTEALSIQDEGESMMTNAQYAEVERRAKSFEAGESKMLSWGKVKTDIRKKYKAKSK
jgi:putative addiction module component (TIGR02574 family)